MRSVLQRAAEGVATLALTTDAAPHLNADSILALQAAADEARADTSIRSIVIEGGNHHFCSGGTRELLLQADAASAIASLLSQLSRAVLSIPVPTVAAMAGHALGGGLMLGLWCDVVYLAEESLYGPNFLQLGFTPGMGASRLLEEYVGAPLARELLLTGRSVKGRELQAAAVPLSHAVGPIAAVKARSHACAESMASTARLASVVFKGHLAERRRTMLEESLREEASMHELVFADAETRQFIAENYPTALFERSKGTR